MFVDFLYHLRDSGLKVTSTEWLALVQALRGGHARANLNTFYHLARCLLVKRESDYDAYDRAFASFFAGIEAAPEAFIANHEWAHASYLDPRVPGGYHFGASIVVRYWEEIARRLDGDTSAATTVIGTYPSTAYPMQALDHTRADARIIFYFGHGMDRTTLDPSTVTVTGPGGAPVAVTTAPFRGDEWFNVLIATPDADWAPDTTYTVRLANTVQTLYGTSPASEASVITSPTSASPTMNASRSFGNVGSRGRYAAPARRTPSIAATMSA